MPRDGPSSDWTGIRSPPVDGGACEVTQAYNRYSAVVTSEALAIVGCVSIARDLAHKVFARLVLNHSHRDIRDLGESYFRSAGRLQALQYLRDRAREQRAMQHYANEPRKTPEQPYRATERAELRSAIEAAIERLPHQSGVVARLSWVDQLTVPEIAAILGIGEKRVQRHRKTARERLQSWLSHLVDP